ncbi:transporter substrate-binding domain-containing protein [uncultured Marinobacter sp.]|uniref:substrate-binding periplasmic protein n=1 Tax=uncultured Marinobacter sp. TaxID=187379 RepID=UPI0026261A11|nr:transporter substrate-binding domain-containing protein [uncultured Marinobacter sp.]
MATLVVGVALMVTGGVQADDSRPVLRIAYAEFPPIEYRDADGEAAGLFIELTRKVAEEAGYTPDFLYLPVGRIYLYMKTGEIDVWPGLTAIPSLREEVLESWVRPIPVQLSAWHVDGTPPLTHLDDLRGKTVIVISGYTYGGLLQKLQSREDVHITEAPNHRAGVDMLKRQRGDYLLDYRQPVLDILNQPSDRVLRHSEVRTRHGAWLYSLANPRASILREEFDDAYQRLAERGEVPPAREFEQGYFIIPGFPEDLPR